MERSLKRPTLHNVAEMAGVAVSTASSILNGRSDSWSSQATRERVFAAVRALHYKPNRMARALRLNRFQAATLVVPDLTNPFYALLARSFQRSMESHGYELLVEETENDPQKETRTLEEAADHNNDGVIVVLLDPAAHTAHLAELAQKAPVLLFGAPLPESPIDTLQSDARVSIGRAIEHLTGLGHRRVGFVDALSGVVDTVGRLAIFREEAARAGVEFDGSAHIGCTHDIAEARIAAGRWASQTPASARATALLCTNDVTAIGTIRGLLDAGLSVPGDVSVVGFDDIPVASYLTRPLTTISQPVAQMAAAATRTLLDRIGGKLDGPSTHQIFPTALIIRETTAAPPPNRRDSYTRRRV